MSESIIKEHTIIRTEINSYGVLTKPLCKVYDIQTATDYMNKQATYNIDVEGYTREEKNTPNEITLNKMGTKLVYRIESIDVDIASLKKAFDEQFGESNT